MTQNGSSMPPEGASTPPPPWTTALERSVAAAIPAGAVVDIFELRPAAEFERLIQVASHHLMKLLHLLLRLHEVHGRPLAHQVLSQGLKLGDFLLFDIDSSALLHLKQLAKLVHLLQLKFQILVPHKGIDLLLQLLEIGLVNDGLTKIESALNDAAFFGVGIHEWQAP